jgi:SagB-type dehydrogenase family enzyme
MKSDQCVSFPELNLIGGLTLQREYPNGTFYLRSVPSAGGLFPFEIYLQAREVDGLIDGIYHYEPYQKELVLLHRIALDGLEYYTKEQKEFMGLTFLITAPYFRSSWKYRNRAIRYIFLDAGHQIGAIYAALELMDAKGSFIFDFDKLELNEKLNFREDELCLAMVQSGVKKDKKIDELYGEFSYVSPSDHQKINQSVLSWYKQSAFFEDDELIPNSFFSGINKDDLKDAIINRRSIREFKQKSISYDEFSFILLDIIPFMLKYNLNLYYTVHNVKEIDKGLYKNSELISLGDFSKKSGYLALEQKIGEQSAVTFYFTSSEEIKYQKVYMLAGFIAHIIYLRCELKNIGCSGIGAYYDDECKSFLKTNDNILYLLAVGR